MVYLLILILCTELHNYVEVLFLIKTMHLVCTLDALKVLFQICFAEVGERVRKFHKP